jgi:hypothetical protein
MGFKKPMRHVFTRPSPAVAFTLGEIIAVGWSIRLRCERCGRTAPVDLQKLLRRRGARITLWDRFIHCPYEDCRGLICFQARAYTDGDFWDLAWFQLRDGGHLR